jgi:NADPH-dependent glutamate synthase beta subunit-like oxidoreductase
MPQPAPIAPALPWQAPSPISEPPALQRLAEDILARCRGEGPANCVARCPLHVDARGYVQLARDGKFREALQLVREKLPFPGVLGYVCAHPCEQHCKRIDDDSAIRIRDIKRFLAEWEPGAPAHLLDCEPDRGQRVVIVGAGPAGLIAAYDLRRRGYGVTVYEQSDRLGGCLAHHIPSSRLPARVLERDLSIIAALGIGVRLGVRVGTDVTLAELRRDGDALLLFPGFGGALDLLRRDGAPRPSRHATIAIDPITGATGIDGVFAAGDAVIGPSTVIHALAHGRRAAESAHRFLAGQALATDREPALPSPLLWKLSIDESERGRRERMPTMLEPAGTAMSEQEVKSESARCLDCHCGVCVSDCEFLAKHCRTPKDLARRVLAGIDPPDTRTVAYSCNVCELCATVCPEGLDTGRLMLEARRESVRRGLGPLPQHKPIVGYWKAGVSRPFTLAMSEPGRQRSRRLFFTGCALPAVAPAHTIAVYDALRRHYPGTGVLMWCCGAPAELLGMEDGFASTRAQIEREMDRLGADELIAACPDCMHTLKSALPEVTITTVWERLAGQWAPPRARDGVAVSIHDSCKARHESALHGAVRQLIGSAGAAVQDIDYNGARARCCGFGGMIAPVDPALCKAVTTRRAAETPLPMVTYCAGCRVALAGCGKESLHILDFLLADDWRAAATRRPPGALPRYANRLRTKWAFKRLRPLAARTE